MFRSSPEPVELYHGRWCIWQETHFLSRRGNILSTLDQKLLENVQKDFWEKYLNLHLQEFP